ncbi:MAG: hypothetical protein M1820_010208 [Bogoriella megaspora]|nr:MAG: hypothetical protein M1820_010208 [Bogoriella megaspora]
MVDVEVRSQPSLKLIGTKTIVGLVGMNSDFEFRLSDVRTFVGSAIAFFKDSYAVVNSGLNENGDTFKLTLAGEEFYVVTNPKDIIEVYKNNTSLSFDVFIYDLMLSCGASPDTVKKMSSSPPPYFEGYSISGLNPANKSLVRLAIDFHHGQLLNGPKSHVSELTDAFLGYINDFSGWDHLDEDPKLSAYKTADTMELSLLDWCGKVLIEAGTKTYWGNALWEIAPDMLTRFYSLDRGMWKILFQYPKVFSTEVIAARDSITNILTRYYMLPLEQRSDAAWFTKSLEIESRAAGLNEEEMAAAIMIIFFVINGNTYKFCFWSLCHILADSNLHAAIRAEIFPDPTSSSQPTMTHLLSNCPTLDSVLSEVLRLYTSSASMRYIDADTTIGNKVLRKGRRIMIPYRQLHERADVYGADAMTFKPERFLMKKSLKKSSCYRPFGGGATLCAGRFVAMQEVLSFIGTAMYRYEIEMVKQGLDGARKIPRVDSKKPTFGMMSPIEGDNFQVKITRKF